MVEAEQIVATCGIPGIVAPGYVSKIARIETMRKNFALLLEYPYKLVEEVHEIDWKFAKRIDEIWNSYATVKIDDINLKNNLNTDLSDFFVTLKDKGSDRTRLRNKFYLESVNNPKDKVSLVDIYEKHKDELDAIYYGTEKPEKDLVGESIRSREEAIKKAYDRQKARREQLYRAEDMKSSQKIWEQLQEKTLTEEDINDFWLNDPMFEYSYWYQDEKNMAVATAYLRTEIELTGPYVVIKSGKLTEQEEIKKSRIGVLLRLLANAEMKGADDRLLPALENTCARYGKDLYDGIGYSEEDGFIITDEFLDILVKNEEERKCQEFGFLCEKGLGDVIDATMLVAGWYAYSKGLPETTSDGRYTEERMEVERQEITNETVEGGLNSSYQAPKITTNSRGELTNGNFVLDAEGMIKHTDGTVGKVNSYMMLMLTKLC